MDGTRDPAYTDRLLAQQNVWWKRVLDVQRPYRWNLRRQGLGRTIDIGCGIGRNLTVLPAGSIGVDHNAASIGEARARGLDALTVEEWEASPERVTESFDGLYLAHVIEHMDPAAGRDLLRAYLPYLRPGGLVFIVCPQERGYASDPTHEYFADDGALASLVTDVGLTLRSAYSFPFPRSAGKLFTYNEFCVLAEKPLP
jgi:SAM-dependent methyltransferase